MRSLLEIYTQAANTRIARAFRQEQCGRADVAARNWAAADRFAFARWQLLAELERAEAAKEVA